MDIRKLLRELRPNAIWQILWEFLGPTVLTGLTAIIQMIRAVPLDWWVLGTVFVGSLILFVYADRRRWSNAEECVRSPILEVNTNTGQWPLPSPDVVLAVAERLKRPDSEVCLKIVAGAEGQAVADLLVRVLRLMDWRLQDNAESASYVFPLSPDGSFQGIRVRYRQSHPVFRLCGFFLSSILNQLVSYPVKDEYFPETDAYNFIQIEIGSPLSSSGLSAPK